MDEGGWAFGYEYWFTHSNVGFIVEHFRHTKNVDIVLQYHAGHKLI